MESNAVFQVVATIADINAKACIHPMVTVVSKKSAIAAVVAIGLLVNANGMVAVHVSKALSEETKMILVFVWVWI